MLYNKISLISNLFLKIAKDDGLSAVEQLKKYVKDSPPYYYIHFTKDPKFWGPNVKQRWATPLGIYAYPLTSDIVKNINKDSREIFRRDLEYIHVYEPTTSNILNTKEYTQEDLLKDIKKVKSDLTLEDLKEVARVKTPAGMLFYLVFKLSGGSGSKNDGDYVEPNPKKSWRIFHSVLGYNAILDEGEGIIHPNEPTQALFFSSKYLNVIDVIHNKSDDRSVTSKEIDLIKRDFLKNLKNEEYDLILSSLDNFKKHHFYGEEIVGKFIGKSISTFYTKYIKNIINKINNIKKKIKHIKDKISGESYSEEYLGEYTDSDHVKKVYLTLNKLNKQYHILDRNVKEFIKFIKSLFDNVVIGLSYMISNFSVDFLRFISYHIDDEELAFSVLDRGDSSLLVNYINYNDSDFRVQVSEKLSVEYLPQMMNDKSTTVRIIVAHRLPVEHLPHMIKDKNAIVRETVAQRIDASYLPYLMNDDDGRVRNIVAMRISDKYLSEMANDKSSLVRYTVLKRLPNEKLKDFINDPNVPIREFVANKISKEYLPHMMKDESYRVRAIVVERISPEYLIHMVDDKNYNIRIEVARRIPEEHLDKLKHDVDVAIQQIVNRRLDEKDTY